MFARSVKPPRVMTAWQAAPVGASAAQQEALGPARARQASNSDTSRIAGRVAGRGVDDVIRSPGQPLALDRQRHFSAGFGCDFSTVRIHADAPAAASARALRANAYTVGEHIAFAPGRYEPDKVAGRRLLAHELAHVVQQRAGGNASPGPAQERDADDASRALAAGEAPRVAAPSQVGIAAQREQPAAAGGKQTPPEWVQWWYRFYTERYGYKVQDLGGNRRRLINPAGGHFVELTFDAQSPRVISVVVVSKKSYHVSEFNFSSGKFETRARQIEMVEYERELSIPERIGVGFRSTGKLAGGAALCVWGTAESVGFGAVAACGYGADVAASGMRELSGEDTRTLANQAVSSGLSHLVGEKTAQELTNDAENAINVMLGAYGAATPPKAPVVTGARPPASDIALPESTTSGTIESAEPQPPAATPPKPQPPAATPPKPQPPAASAPKPQLPVASAPKPQPPVASPPKPQLPAASATKVELRTPSTLDLGTPKAAATSRAVTTRPMRKLPGGAPRGAMGQGAGDPVAYPRSRLNPEARTQGSLDYGEPEGSATPESQAPDPWLTPQRPTKPTAPRAPSGHHAATGQAAVDARTQGLEDLQKGRLGVQEHRTASAVREATGQTGQDIDSTHLVPQAVYRAIGVSPDIAPTVNLPRAVNNAIDSAWVGKWIKATRLGQQVTGRQVRQWVTQGIRQVPDTMLSQAAKNSLEWAFGVELKGLGIGDDTVIVPRVE